MKHKNIINQIFKKIYGKPCWNVRWDTQLGLWMEFGKPSLWIREPFASNSKFKMFREVATYRGVSPQGEYFLCIDCVNWRIILRNKCAATNRTPYNKKMRIALARLDGQKLAKITVNPRSGATRFYFDLGGVLEVTRYNRKDIEDLWTIYLPKGMFFSIRGDGKYRFYQSSVKTSKEVYLPIKG